MILAQFMIMPRSLSLLFAVLVAAVLPLAAQESVPLLDAKKPAFGWSFNDGREFPGAKGGVAKDAAVQHGADVSLKITGDFTAGGVYVAANGRIPNVDVQELSFWVKNLETDRITLRVMEASGRCHQFTLKANPSADWQLISLPLQSYFERQGRADAVENVLKYEAWGGGAESFQNDGSWKGPGTGVSIVIANPRKEQIVRTIWIAGVTVVVKPKPAPVTAFTEDFEKDARMPARWTVVGDVTVDAGASFQGERALTLRKTDATLRAPTSATGPEFQVQSGVVEVEFAAQSDLISMDNSYNGTLSLEFFDASGRPLGPYELGAWFRKNPWKRIVAQVQVPDQAASARMIAAINKETPGTFSLDGLSAKMAAGETADDGLRRMMFTMAQLGHLILPTDSREASVEVWSTKELPENLREAAFTVRDYWHAEQNRPIRLTLAPAGKVPGRDYFKYEAKVDLAGIDLKIGSYYELHGEIARPGGKPFTNYTSFAILPEAAANQYQPGEVPFTSRTWDQRSKESPLLTHRLGIRICNVWGSMTADPAKVDAAQIELSAKLGLGVVTSSPAMGVEARKKGWEELLANDGALIRQGVRNFLAKYGHIKPMIVNLGNEPHNKGEDARRDVDAYRIVYTEIKKIDPSIFVVGTSIGVEQEDYFKFGFGEWCDAYDFHSYEDPEGVRTILTEKYPAMFKKYGFAKPVWSTEIGMNSQGMTRQAVAALVYKKFASFFAGGGANVSWFGLFYPDGEAKQHNSFASAHNVFDSRYNKYAPKLDAIAYYNAVNGISIKKFVTDTVYADRSRVFLFRDRDQRSLIIAYKDKGREDVFLPLPGVKSVEMIRLDGSRDQLDAGGKGIALTLGEDPVLLLFENGPATLPEKLEVPAVRLSSLPSAFFRDGENIIDAALNGVSWDNVSLLAPPFWNVRSAPIQTPDGKPAVRFSIKVAPDSEIRDADLTLLVKDAGGASTGLLSVRVPVAGRLALDLLPIPAGEDKGPGVRLVLKNNSLQPQSLSWGVVLNGQQSLDKGIFTPVVSSPARFETASSGAIRLEPGATNEVRLALVDAKPITVYHVSATLRDESGRVITQERPVGGFIPVRRALQPLNVDGVLDEAAWAGAWLETLDQQNQFYGFKLSGKEAPLWSGVDDLSARIRYLWDDRFLYVAVQAKDDIAGSLAFEGADLWRTDGLQFLIDPTRGSNQKPGKYEYVIGLGKQGPQAWCTLSADAGAPSGNATDIRLAIKRDKENSGDTTYEIAIPWARVAPFKPEQGGNLGFTLIVNEDDGPGRDAFMTWFGNAHSKDVDTVGDLILMP